MECLGKRYQSNSKKPVIAVYDFDMTCIDTSFIHNHFEKEAFYDEAVPLAYDSNDNYNFDKTISSISKRPLYKNDIIRKKNKKIQDFAEKMKKEPANEQEEYLIKTIESNIKKFKELEETWEYLRENGVEIAICTNAHQQYFDFVCKITGLDKQIEKYGVTVVTADQFTNGKPHHEPIEKVIEDTAYKAGFDWHDGVRVVKIGDMRRDIESAYMANELLDECDILGLLFADDGNVPDDMYGYKNKISSHHGLIDIINNLESNMNDALEEQSKFFEK